VCVTFAIYLIIAATYHGLYTTENGIAKYPIYMIISDTLRIYRYCI